MVGYPSVYYESSKKSAKISIKTRLNPKNSGAELKYFFNGSSQASSNYSVSSPAGLL